MSCKKTRSKNRKSKKRKKYCYLFHISTQPRKYLQPCRTTWCFEPDEDRTQALLFLCQRREIKDWISWVMGKIRDRHKFTKLGHGGYVTLYIHVVRVRNTDLIQPNPRIHGEFVVKDRLSPRAIVPIRVYWTKRIELTKLNSTLKRLNEVKRKV